MALRRWLSQNVLRVKQNPVAPAAIPTEALTWGTGQDWMPPVYGEYYARSILIYAAVKIRAENIIRPTLRVYRVAADGTREEVARNHPLAELMRRVNGHWTTADLWRATSTYLDLWGSAFWGLTKPSPNQPPTEIWAMRPDYVRVLVAPDGNLKGFIYQRNGRQIPLLPDEVVWFQYFNPMSEYSGMSPIAALRLSADMGIDALKSNRNLFKNGLLFGNLAISFKGIVTDPQIKEFNKRLQMRFAGPDNAFRPLILGDAAEAKNMGFAPKDMEHIQTLRWSLEDVCRAYGVPKTLLHDLTNATYSNVDAEERIFWRNTLVSHLRMLQDRVTEMLLPQFARASGEELVVEFDLSDIEALRPDQNLVAERQRADVQQGLVTINEARAERGLSAVPWGDSWWAPMTLLPITSGSTPQLPEGEPQEAMALLSPPRPDMVGPDGWKRWNPPELSDTALGKALDLHIKRLDRHERGFKASQQRLFARQERETVRRLRSQKTEKLAPGESLFTADEWLEQWVSTGKPLFVRAVLEEAGAQIAQYGLGISFDITAPSIADWVRDRIGFWARRVNDETARLLMSELTEASVSGESIKQIQERVEKVFRFSDSVRSERIARTEMQSATNRGAVEAYKQSHVVEGKMWLAILDDRTRDGDPPPYDHVSAHKQVMPLEAQFEVSGEMLDAPGDDRGSPGNIINCRCAVAPIVRRGARVQPTPTPALVYDDTALRGEVKSLVGKVDALALRPIPQPKRIVVKEIKRDAEGWPVSVIETEREE